MCKLCDDNDGRYKCGDCGVPICLEPDNHRVYILVDGIRFFDQAVKVDGEYYCDGCSPYYLGTILSFLKGTNNA